MKSRVKATTAQIDVIVELESSSWTKEAIMAQHIKDKDFWAHNKKVLSEVDAKTMAAMLWFPELVDPVLTQGQKIEREYQSVLEARDKHPHYSNEYHRFNERLLGMEIMLDAAELRGKGKYNKADRGQ